MDRQSLILAAQQRQKENQKDLPKSLETLLNQMAGGSIVEDNGRLKLVAIEDLDGTPIPPSLGLLLSVREMTEGDFTALAIALLKGEAKLNMASYQSSDNHYITFNAETSDGEEDSSSSSSTRRRGGRRGGNRA